MLEENLLKILQHPEKAEALKFKTDFLESEKSLDKFNIINAIPILFPKNEEVHGLNLKYQKMYDWMARGYDVVEQIAGIFGSKEFHQVRTLIRDELGLKPGFKILETSIGTGVNFRNNQVDAEIYGLDISMGMLLKCQANQKKWKQKFHLVQGNAEALPFKDASFDVVFHFGGINFFNDKNRAVQEMIRVAKSGAKIILGDETEEEVKALPFLRPFYENKNSKVYEPPTQLIPKEMQNVREQKLWNNKLYLISFFKP